MPTEPAADAPLAPGAELAPAPAPEIDEAGWSRAVVVASGRVPQGIGRRKVIVVETQTQAAVRNEDGSEKEPARYKVEGYPSDADLYYGVTGEAKFPADKPAFILGQNVRPSGNGGFSPKGVRVANGHPAYAAANLAYQQGARDIVIAGVSKADQEKLEPWFASSKIPEDAKISFA